MEINNTTETSNFMARFYKLGFDKSKMKLANFDREKITRMLNEITLIKSGNIEFSEKKLDDLVGIAKKVLYVLLPNVNLKVNKFDNELDGVQTKNKTELQEYFTKLLEDYKKGEINEELVGELLLLQYEKLSTKGSVFTVPVIKNKELDSMQGGTLKGPCILGSSIETIKKSPVYSEAIYLGAKSPNILSIGTYAHEIMHNLIDRHKASVENYYNDELIPIFMEKVVTDKVDKSPNKRAVKASEIHRLYHTRELLNKVITDDISDIEIFEAYKYIQSTLYAGILYDIYSNSSEEEKNKILLYVKNILSGNIKVNDIIDAYELSLDGPEVDKYIDKVGSYVKEFPNKTTKYEKDGKEKEE